MSSLQRYIAAITDTTANLVTLLRELDLLREQVRKAEEFYQLADKNVTRIEHPQQFVSG